MSGIDLYSTFSIRKILEGMMVVTDKVSASEKFINDEVTHVLTQAYNKDIHSTRGAAIYRKSSESEVASVSDLLWIRSRNNNFFILDEEHEITLTMAGARGDLEYELQSGLSNGGGNGVGVTSNEGFIRTQGTDDREIMSILDEYLYEKGLVGYIDSDHFIDGELELFTRWMGLNPFSCTLWTKYYYDGTLMGHIECGFVFRTTGSGFINLKIIGQWHAVNSGGSAVTKPSIARPDMPILGQGGGLGPFGCIIRVGDFGTTETQELITDIDLHIHIMRAGRNTSAGVQSQSNIMIAYMGYVENCKVGIGLFGKTNTTNNIINLFHFGFKYDPDADGFDDENNPHKTQATYLETYHPSRMDLYYLTPIDNEVCFARILRPYEFASCSQMTVWPYTANGIASGCGWISCGDYCDTLTVERQRGTIGKGMKIGFIKATKCWQGAFSTEANNGGFYIKGVGTVAGSGFFYSGTSANIPTYADALNYDNQTINFAVGSVVVGLTSGATGTVIDQTDSGTTGTLYLSAVSGAFEDNEELQVSGVTRALADGILYSSSHPVDFADLVAISPQPQWTGNLGVTKSYQLEYDVDCVGFDIETLNSTDDPISPDSVFGIHLLECLGKVRIGHLMVRGDARRGLEVEHSHAVVQVDRYEGVGTLSYEQSRGGIFRNINCNQGLVGPAEGGTGIYKPGFDTSNVCIQIVGNSFVAGELADDVAIGDTIIPLVDELPQDVYMKDKVKIGTVWAIVDEKSRAAVTVSVNHVNGPTRVNMGGVKYLVVKPMTAAVSAGATVTVDQRCKVDELQAGFESSQWGLRVTESDVFNCDLSEVKWTGQYAAYISDAAYVEFVKGLPTTVGRAGLTDAIIRCEDDTSFAFINGCRIPSSATATTILQLPSGSPGRAAIVGCTVDSLTGIVSSNELSIAWDRIRISDSFDTLGNPLRFPPVTVTPVVRTGGSATGIPVSVNASRISVDATSFYKLILNVTLGTVSAPTAGDLTIINNADSADWPAPGAATTGSVVVVSNGVNIPAGLSCEIGTDKTISLFSQGTTGRTPLTEANIATGMQFICMIDYVRAAS